MKPQQFIHALKKNIPGQFRALTVSLCSLLGIFSGSLPASGASETLDQLEMVIHEPGDENNIYEIQEKALTQGVNDYYSWPSELSRIVVLFSMPTSDEFKGLLRGISEIEDFDQITKFFSYRNLESDKGFLNFYRHDLQPTWRQELRLRNKLDSGNSCASDFFSGLATLGVVINTVGNFGWLGVIRDSSEVSGCEMTSDHPFVQLCKSLDAPDEDGFNCAVEFDTGMQNTTAFYCTNADDKKVWNHSASEDARIDQAILINACLQLSGVACWGTGLVGHLILNKIKKWRRSKLTAKQDELRDLINQFQNRFAEKDQDQESTDGALTLSLPGQKKQKSNKVDTKYPEGKIFVQKILYILDR